MIYRYFAAFAVAAACSSALPAYAAGGAKHDAKVSMADARRTALGKVPGKVVDEELEHEAHRWIYSFEIRAVGQTGKAVTEVNVDADSGVIVDVHTEKD